LSHLDGDVNGIRVGYVVPEVQQDAFLRG
jgi:hypothetical protein